MDLADFCYHIVIGGLASMHFHAPRGASTLGLASQEGIVNISSEDTPGREFVEHARAALSEEEVA